MNFSVLMSIYSKENPDYFDQAMTSIWDHQILKPKQIVLVKDGPLTKKLTNIIESWKTKLGDIFTVVSLDENMGLGDALNIGLDSCKYELVARMDTDDISHPQRFKIQIQQMIDNEHYDIIGSYVTEFDHDPDTHLSIRKVPCINEEIIEDSKIKNPFNHPSVMYKKSSVISAGSYKKFDGFEDYYLWVRMIINGAKCFNISIPLVNMRAGYSMLGRRGGLKYAINEVKLQHRFYRLGFLTRIQVFKNLIIRIPIRLLPNKIRALIYRIIRT